MIGDSLGAKFGVMLGAALDSELEVALGAELGGVELACVLDTADGGALEY
jgi:hypothetical protein